MNSSDEIKLLRQLLKIEKEEDLQQYRRTVVESSVQERVQNGTTWYPVKITDTGIGRGEQVYVEVERTNNKDIDHQLQSGKRGALFCNTENNGDKQRVEGVIGVATRDRLRIYLNADELPDWIRDGKIGVDMLFDESSYKEMDETLRQVAEAENTRLAYLRGVLLGSVKPEFKEEDIPVNIPHLNESQNKAIGRILGAKDVAIVHGPPGTGKTTTFIQAIRLVANEEKQVLVTAPSNTAVDLLCEKLQEEGLKVIRIGHPARVSDNLLNLTLDNQIANHSYYADIKSLRKKANEYREMAFKYKRNFGREEAQQRKMLLDEARSLKSEAIKLEDYIISDLLSEAHVIACTLVGANNSYLKDKTYKTVFIDEAAQALEPACWVPIMKARRVIMAGDHHQLPPTVKSFEAGQKGLNITLFEKTIRRQKVDTLLEVQYRMNEKIMEFSNQQFYAGKLKAHESVSSQTLGMEGDHPVEFIDTAGCGYTEKTESSRSAFNPEEADLLLKHLNGLLEVFEKECSDKINEDFRVGIISPYKAQIRYITEHITEYPILERYLPFIAIKTIDGFQGQECKIVAISLVRSNDKGEIGFLGDTRRMNVAMTRAKKKLIMIGDSATLGENKFYSQFLDYVQAIDAYKSAWELIGE